MSINTPDDMIHEYPDLGRTNWTWETVDQLERDCEQHLRDCDECGAAVEQWFDANNVDLDDIDTLVYCPVGESLQVMWVDASIEWSWQPDFPKQDDPRWDEWHQLHKNWFDELWSH